MSAIEERVVAMKFQGEQFLAGIQKSLQSLDKLNAKLKMEDGTKGLDNLGSAADKQANGLSRLADGVEKIGGRFKTLGVISASVLNSITAQAVTAGESLLKSFSFKPISDGFHEYETNLNAIQTILSNTAAAGTNLKQVNAALNELNIYSDQTIYNFSEMAKNIGTFTAAGVDLKTATGSIKGIANLAALSGSNSQQASTAMYQLSQAISSGKVSLEDWNSVVNAGMGGTVFQRALVENAVKMGKINDGAVKLTGSMKNVTIGGKSFRDSITAKPGQNSWLTSDVLTRTLQQFTGDLTDAQLKAQGFNATQIKAIQQQAKMAKDAATQVKTFSQLVSTLGESAGSGWATTWQTIFGDFGEAKSLFTNVNNTLGGFIKSSADARNKVLGDWKALGGRTALINAVSNSFNVLISVVKPIKDAFREIFPAVTGKQLADISKSIEKFTASLKIGGTTANNIKRTFAGFFAVLDIGFMVVKEAVKTFLTLVGVITNGSGGFLKTTASIGDFLVGVRNAIKEGDGLTKFFGVLGKVLAFPLEMLKKLGSFLGTLFKGFNSGDAVKNVTALTAKLEPLGALGKVVAGVWSKMGVVISNVVRVFAPLADKMVAFFQNIGKNIASAFSGINFKDVLGTINTGVFAGLALTIHTLISKLKGGLSGGGFLDGIKESFEQLTKTLSAMQNTLKAATLLEIAGAVALLTVSVVGLSKIDAGGLTRALTAMTVMFTQLGASLYLFQKFIGAGGTLKLPFITTSLIALAAAVDILASAVVKLSGLDWNGIGKGLTGLAGILALVVGALHLMPNPAGLISTSTGLVILAAGIKILATAVAYLSGLSWEELGKGLVGVGVLLGSLTLFTKFSEADAGGIAQGVGIVLLATGINILAVAVKNFAQMSWSEIAKGLVTLAGSLAVITGALAIIPPDAPAGAAGVLILSLSLGKIAAALNVMAQMNWGAIGKSLTTLLGSLAIMSAALVVIPPDAPLGAAAILIVALALNQVATVLNTMGAMDWAAIGKSMVVLAGSLTLIAAAAIVMTGAIAGAGAMIIMAGALAILAPVLLAFGNMSWEAIGKGLLVLAGALTVIGLAGALLTPVIPSLIGLGIAVGLLGVGMLAAGVGMLAFSAALAALAISGAAGTAALIAIVSGLIALIPAAIEAVGKGLILFAQVIATAGPAITNALVTVLNSLLDAIATITPKIVSVLYRMLTQLIQTMAQYVPQMVDAGLKLITGVLDGIAKNAGRLSKSAADVVVAFLNGISANQGRVIDSAVKMIISFVNGLANAIRQNTGAMQAAGRNLAFAIIDGMTGGLASGLGRVIESAKNIASSAINAAKNVLDINSPSKEFIKIGNSVNEGFRKGLDGNKGQVDAAFTSLRDQVKAAMDDSAKDAETLTAKLKKLEGARHKDRDAINQTKQALAQAKKEHSAESAAYTLITKQLNTQHAALGALANQYDVVTEKLKNANDTLANAIKTRDDYNKQISDEFSKAPDATGETTVADYIANLSKQVDDTKSFSNTLQQLRKLGLSDAMYKQLLSTGTSSLPFIQELLKNGKGSIDQINALSSQLNYVAGSLGSSASSQLYQAAVDSAAGLVKGLQNQQAAIEAQMDRIADSMVNAIKKKLGIKSPSRVFAAVGQFSAQGLANGLSSSTSIVSQSAENVGNQAVETMRKTLANMTKMTISDLTLQPTIKPVLDLTSVKKDAGQIGSLIPKASLSVDGAYSHALAASTAIRNAAQNAGLGTSDTPASPVTYVQNNYSPKAISAADTYRNTKNQLSKAKGALATSAKQN